MARTNSYHDIHQVYIHAALIASHANFLETGFRQKDLKFFLELMKNWNRSNLYSNLKDDQIQNNQVKRIIQKYVDEGLVTLLEKKQAKRTHKSNSNTRPSYTIKRLGLLEVASQLVDLASLSRFEDFLFLHHFVTLYSPKILELIFDSVTSVPQSYRLEINHLLNGQSLKERYLKLIELEHRRLKLRIEEGREMAKLGKKLTSQGRPLNEVIQTLEKKFPYELNHQKSMQELFNDIRPDLQMIEVSQGPQLRSQSLWAPQLKLLEQQQKMVESL